MKNTDPNYGDNTVCDVCEDFLDFGFNLKPNEKNGGKWICVRCVDYLVVNKLENRFASSANCNAPLNTQQRSTNNDLFEQVGEIK